MSKKLKKVMSSMLLVASSFTLLATSSLSALQSHDKMDMGQRTHKHIHFDRGSKTHPLKKLNGHVRGHFGHKHMFDKSHKQKLKKKGHHSFKLHEGKGHGHRPGSKMINHLGLGKLNNMK